MKVRSASKGWNVFFTVALSLTAAGLLFNLWFINNTDTIIESMVASQSQGKLQLHLEHSKFHYFKKKLELYGADFYSTDTANATTAYHFRVQKLELKLKSFWRFLLYRQLLIDSINLTAPDVTVTRLKESTKGSAGASITEEAGTIYNSITDALDVLKVKRFLINDGRFTLVNKTTTTPLVSTVSNIQFYINNFHVNSDSAASATFLSSDDVVLRIRNQDVLLPDGIHRISFKNLVVNVRQKQAQVDSCWVKAGQADTKNAFHVFFDVLKLTKLDFDALYAKSLIKADSVYITNPAIDLAFDVKQHSATTKKFELDTIIQQFTGDLDLGYIGVQNAKVNIVANHGDSATTFSSTNDNFNMYNLRIDHDATSPVYVGAFKMVLRNYETYSRDSSRVYRFDSIGFTNNKVRLSNFTIQSIAGRQQQALFYSIPAFELTGLSWEDLLFDRYIRAKRALLVNPEIQYTIAAEKKKVTDASLFKVLSGLNETIDLDEVEIQNGTVNIQLPGAKKLTLEHVDVLLASNRLLASKSYTGVKQAIDQLVLRHAEFNTSNLHATVSNLRYTSHLYADALHLTNTTNTLTADVKGITLDDLVWNNAEKSIVITNLAWQQGAVVLKTGLKSKPGKDVKGRIEINGITGNNTALTLYGANHIITTTLDRLLMAQLTKTGASNPELKGITIHSKALDVTTNSFHLASGPYQISEDGNITINALSFLQQSGSDTIQANVPRLFLKTHLPDLWRGQLAFQEVSADAPVLHLAHTPAAVPASKTVAPLRAVSIKTLQVMNPTVRYSAYGTANTVVEWAAPGTKNQQNHWTFSNIHTDAKGGLAADGAELTGHSLLLSRNSQSVGVDSGLIHVALRDIYLNNNDSVYWKAYVQEALFQNPRALTLEEQGGISVQRLQLRNVQLSSVKLKNGYQLLQNNPDLELLVTNGQIAGTHTNFQWNQLRYNQSGRSLSIDSLQYTPVLSKDSFLAKAPGQTDYMHGLFKNITASGIDLAALEQDSTFAARSIHVAQPRLFVYRDKRKPLLPGNIRPLPVFALQKLDAKLSVDTVVVRDGVVAYSEISDKTNQEGIVTVNRINARLLPVRNTGLGAHDSLALEAEGYLMDSAWLRLCVNESYNDSLGTFIMKLQLKPTDMSVLNPVLVPLASVKFMGGELDTLSMRAVGNDYVSFGEMQMYYKNLNVRFLKHGNETKKSFVTSLISFVANNFVIRRNNDHRSGAVYFLRNRDRSVFNFLVKTALSGVATSIGVKRNKKYYRQYKRQQKLYNLPAIDVS